MSHSGPLGELTQLYHAREYQKAAEVIKGIQDRAHAEAVFQLITKIVNVDSWLAFLKNPHLKPFIYHHELTLMLNKVMVISVALKSFMKKKLSNDSCEVKRKQANMCTLLVAIVENDDWCKVMSYSYFIAFVPHNPLFASYIANSSQFLRHLDFYHINLLLTKLPRKTSEILTTLDTLILQDEEVSEWVIAILKWLIINNANVQREIFQESFTDCVEQLGLEFEEDVAFAIEVLQTPFLCERWLGIKDQPFMHEKFTFKDYKRLMEHYLPINPALGLQYAELFHVAAKGELHEMVALQKNFAQMELTEDFPLIISEVFEKAVDQAQNLADLADPMSIERTKPPY
ncbi:MAG: hypothetical protein AB7I18_02985 [Candidatus Berkiella sp.]